MGEGDTHGQTIKTRSFEKILYPVALCSLPYFTYHLSFTFSIDYAPGIYGVFMN